MVTQIGFSLPIEWFAKKIQMPSKETTIALGALALFVMVLIAAASRKKPDPTPTVKKPSQETTVKYKVWEEFQKEGKISKVELNLLQEKERLDGHAADELAKAILHLKQDSFWEGDKWRNDLSSRKLSCWAVLIKFTGGLDLWEKRNCSARGIDFLQHQYTEYVYINRDKMLSNIVTGRKGNTEFLFFKYKDENGSENIASFYCYTEYNRLNRWYVHRKCGLEEESKLQKIINLGPSSRCTINDLEWLKKMFWETDAV